MRLLLNAVNLDPAGGSERSLIEMAVGLAERGYDLDLAYQRSGRFLDTYRKICDTTTPVSLMHPERRRLRSALALATSVWRLGRETPRPDLVFVNDFWEVLYGAGLGFRLGAPLVCHLRNDRPVGIENAIALARCARLIAVSHFVASRYVDAGVEERLIEVVHLGVDPVRYRPVAAAIRVKVRRSLGVADETKMILYAGRLDQQKGLDVLLEALRHLRTSMPSVKLVIAGCEPATGTTESGYASALRRREGDWTWAPAAEDMVPYYGAADLVVVPSIGHEASSRVPLEAMACGCPVVASRAGGLPESFEAGLESLLVPPGDADALATKVAWGVGWHQHSPALGRRCRDHVQRHFSLEKELDGIERALGAAVEEDRRRQARHRVARLSEWAVRARPLVASARS